MDNSTIIKVDSVSIFRDELVEMRDAWLLQKQADLMALFGPKFLFRASGECARLVTWHAKDPQTDWPDCEVTLEFSINASKDPIVEDANGCHWQPYCTRSTINWASYGSTEADLAGARVTLFQVGIDLLKEFDARFSSVRAHLLLSTAEEREQRAASNFWRMITQKAAFILGTVDLKRMQVGGKGRFVDNTTKTNPGWAPEGQYTCSLGDKTYRITISKSTIAIDRTR